MNRIEAAFKNKPIFMPYFPLGYPDLNTSIDVIEALANNGADLIEVGLSFSDPLADGPVIQKATQVALEKGITIRKSLEAVKELRTRGVDIPLVFMGYYNPMLAYGLERFVRDAIDAGADGFIIPDLPPEEAEEFVSALSEATAGRVDSTSLSYRDQESAVEAQTDGVNRASTASETRTRSPLSPISLIQMLAPTTSNERMERIARNAQGFIYLVSVTGVTGERKSLSEGLGDLIQRVREHTNVPVCVGFGISTPEQARQVSALADGVIVGSACVKAIGGSETPVETAKQFAAEFRSALREVRP
jgi:tryptophan synthase alpha chain